MKHPVQWLTAAPLWETARAATVAGTAAVSERFRQPALLRFASDGFMEDLLGVLASEPESLESKVAKPETWDKPAVGWVAAGDSSLGELLKLFQPAQGRFYLAAASLVCRRPGLPCRKVDAAAGDRASMVVRRLAPVGDAETLDPLDPATFREQAWVGDREKGRWQAVAQGGEQRVLDGEERLPLFALRFELRGRKRCLHAGMVPVAARELYEGAAPTGTGAEVPDQPDDPLAELADPRKAAWAAGPGESLEVLTGPEDELKDLTDEAARDLLSFVFLDLADLIREELPDLWQALEEGSDTGLGTEEAAVYDRLDEATTWTGAPTTWRAAVLAADQQREVLLGEEDAAPGSVPPVPDDATADDVRAAATALDDPVPDQKSGLTTDLFAALGEPQADDFAEAAAAPGEAPVTAAQGAAAAGAEGGIYVVRCVYERPRCGRLDQPAVSAPSRPFRLASFFDPEAPARPVQIRLPLDTSIAGLKKFPKAVSVLLSNKLRQQVEQIQGASLADLDEGDIKTSEPSWSLGMICSLSIPIITICAFILLMIIVQLLNIVFWWLPFFKICLPIPVRSDS